MQIKAETHILADVQANLDAMAKTVALGDIGSKLKAKQDLLSLLIANEQSRLLVWLFPLDHAKKNHFMSSASRAGLPDVSTTLRIINCLLTIADCGDSPSEDGLGRESSDRRAPGQAIPVSTSDY